MLDEFALLAGTAANQSVPSWALGTVRRQSISFATGFTDDSTQVHWVQSHAMTGDIRIHADRPSLAATDRLEDLDRDTLILLASVEGGVATAAWADGVMTWADWVGFQPYDKYPEAGLMQRVGDCMIEISPSRIYIEDWRFQPSAPGLLAGLRLLADVDVSGTERPRAGGLVIAGDHAICSVARLTEPPERTRAQDFVRHSRDPVGALRQVFGCTVDYAVKTDGTFKIVSSTDPRRETVIADVMSDFSETPVPGVLRQRIFDNPDVIARLWRIDSLEARVAFPLATPAPSDRLAWLEAEADTLVVPHRNSAARARTCA